MACQSQDNPSSSSSDGVPPELEVLGFRVPLLPTGSAGLTGCRLKLASVDRCDRSSSSVC